MFLPNGDLVYRASEGGRNYIYTRHRDGSGRKKLLEEAILDLTAVSPDGRWIVVLLKDDADKDHPYRTLAYPKGGGKPVIVCALCYGAGAWMGNTWPCNSIPLPHSLETYLLPVNGESGLPELPPEGLSSPEDLKEIESSCRTAKRSGFGVWAGEILVHDNEHSQKYLPDPDFVKLVSGDQLYLLQGARAALLGTLDDDHCDQLGVDGQSGL